MKKGEIVLRLRATRDAKCRECEYPIIAGQPFLLDIIPYTEGVGIYRRIKRVKHPIHEWHWKGQKNVIVDKSVPKIIKDGLDALRKEEGRPFIPTRE